MKRTALLATIKRKPHLCLNPIHRGSGMWVCVGYCGDRVISSHGLTPAAAFRPWSDAYQYLRFRNTVTAGMA